MEMREDDLALESAEQAVKFGDNWADAHLTLGRLYINIGELELAKSSIERALELGLAHSNPFRYPENQLTSIIEMEADLEEVLRLLTIQKQKEEAMAAEPPFSNIHPPESMQDRDDS